MFGSARWVVLVGLAGCSFGNVPVVGCEQSSDCLDAFGFGWECGSAGYCTELDVPSRCDRVYPEDLYDRPEEHPDILVFGALFDLNNDLANVRSIELAFIEANEQDGLNGREVGLVTCTYEEDVAFDNLEPGPAAVDGARWLADSVGVRGLVGPAASQLVLDVWADTSQRELFVISPSATSDELVTIDGELSTDEAPGLFWRTAPSDSAQAAAITADIQDRGQTTVAVISQVGAYGDGLAGLLETSLAIPSAQMFPFENSSQLTAAISDVSQIADLQEVVFISSDADDSVAFLNSASQLPVFSTLSLFLTDTARSNDVLAGTTGADASALYPNIRGTNPIPDPASEPQPDFYAAYAGQYAGEDAREDSFNAFSYDAAWLMLYATSWAQLQEDDVNGTTIARGMRQLSSGPTVPIRGASWPSLINGPFADGSSINVAGASGDLDYDLGTGETSAPIAVWTVLADGSGFADDRVCYAGACQAITP